MLHVVIIYNALNPHFFCPCRPSLAGDVTQRPLSHCVQILADELVNDDPALLKLNQIIFKQEIKQCLLIHIPPMKKSIAWKPNYLLPDNINSGCFMYVHVYKHQIFFKLNLLYKNCYKQCILNIWYLSTTKSCLVINHVNMGATIQCFGDHLCIHHQGRCDEWHDCPLYLHSPLTLVQIQWAVMLFITSILMMKAETVFETLDCNFILTCLIIQEDFIAFSCCESFLSYFDIWGFHAVRVQISVFRFVTLCNAVGGYKYFGRTQCFHLQGRSDRRWRQHVPPKFQ
jgi:hypothetical protein